MSKLTDDLRAYDPIASPNVAGILMDAAAGRIEELERIAERLSRDTPIHLVQRSQGPMERACRYCNENDWGGFTHADNCPWAMANTLRETTP